MINVQARWLGQGLVREGQGAGGHGELLHGYAPRRRWGLGGSFFRGGLFMAGTKESGQIDVPCLFPDNVGGEAQFHGPDVHGLRLGVDLDRAALHGLDRDRSGSLRPRGLEMQRLEARPGHVDTPGRSVGFWLRVGFFCPWRGRIVQRGQEAGLTPLVNGSGDSHLFKGEDACLDAAIPQIQEYLVQGRAPEVDFPCSVRRFQGQIAQFQV